MGMIQKGTTFTEEQIDWLNGSAQISGIKFTEAVRFCVEYTRKGLAREEEEAEGASGEQEQGQAEEVPDAPVQGANDPARPSGRETTDRSGDDGQENADHQETEEAGAGDAGGTAVSSGGGTTEPTGAEQEDGEVPGQPVPEKPKGLTLADLQRR